MLSRRTFFKVLGTGVAGFAAYHLARPLELLAQAPVVPVSTARNCIFILLAGAPSHTDTFDLKEGAWTPSAWNPTSYGDIRFPQGLLPQIAARLDQFAIVRSVRAWALVHSLSQTWIQIGRNPVSALGSIAPNIGAVVALEKSTERAAKDVLPGFISLNAGGSQVGAGYFPVTYAPLQVSPSAGGLADINHPDGQARWQGRLKTLHLLDDPLRIHSPLGEMAGNMDGFYSGAQNLMYNPAVQGAFSFTAAERAPFGNNSFGDACLIATKALKADLGTRFVQITLGGWDMHSALYTALPRLAPTLDTGLGTLIDTLQQNALLDQTLIVVSGEFGRTVGAPNNQQGRDHFPQQFALFAGAGVKEIGRAHV